MAYNMDMPQRLIFMISMHFPMESDNSFVILLSNRFFFFAWMYNPLYSVLISVLVSVSS